MNDFRWIDHTLRAEISQGDIFAGVPFCVPTVPVIHLEKGTGKGNKEIWTPALPNPKKPSQVNHGLFAYKVAWGILLSHDCAIDKLRGGTRLLFAPVAPLDTLALEHRDPILQQRHLSLMPVADVPGLGHSYADLRQMTPLQPELVSALERKASLTDAARGRLTSALVAFFTHLKMPPEEN